MKFFLILHIFLSVVSATQKNSAPHNLVAIEDEVEVFCEYEEGCEKDGSRLNPDNSNADIDFLMEDDFMAFVEDFPSLVEEEENFDSTVDWPESSLLLETGAEPEVEYEMPMETVTLPFYSEESEDWPEESNFLDTLASEAMVFEEELETVFVELEEEEQNSDSADTVFLEYEISEITNIDANLMETNAEPEMDYSTITDTVLIEDSDPDEQIEMDSNLEETGAGESYETLRSDIETVSNIVDSTDMMEIDSNMDQVGADTEEIGSNIEATGAEEPSESIEPVTETIYVEIEDTDTTYVDTNAEATGAEEVEEAIDPETNEISLVEVGDVDLEPNLKQTGAVIDSVSMDLKK